LAGRDEQMSTHTTIICDVCGDEAKPRYRVAIHSEEAEMDSFDLCNKCVQRAWNDLYTRRPQDRRTPEVGEREMFIQDILERWYV